MRCPKCKLITFEGNTLCPRCGEDLSPLVQKFGPFYQFNAEEVFLKDTLLTPPPFIGAPGSSEGALLHENPETDISELKEIMETDLPELELSSPSPASETQESLTPSVSEELPEEQPSPGEKPSSEEDVFKELEEALREDQG